MVEDDSKSSKTFELATTNKIYVNRKILNEIKNGISEDYTGDFKLIGSMLIGEIEQKTNVRLRKVEDFETYNNAIHDDYDSEGVIFTGCFYELNSPEFNKKTDLNMVQEQILNKMLLNIQVTIVIFLQVVNFLYIVLVI